jgi:hypothetical protein
MEQPNVNLISHGTFHASKTLEVLNSLLQIMFYMLSFIIRF